MATPQLIDTALGYFENNAPRMRYHLFRQCGLFVGSGVVEASCKTVGQRLKQSGMHWTVNGADAIPPLQRGRQHLGSHLQHPAHSDAHRLTSNAPKMILTTYKIDVHPTARPPVWARADGPQRAAGLDSQPESSIIFPRTCYLPGGLPGQAG